MPIDITVEDHVAVAVLNRPEAMNSIDPEMREQLYAAMREQGLGVPRPVFDDVHDTVDRLLGQEIARVQFGTPGAQQRAVRNDPVVAQAVELLRGVETAEALLRRTPPGRPSPNTGTH